MLCWMSIVHRRCGKRKDYQYEGVHWAVDGRSCTRVQVSTAQPPSGIGGREPADNVQPCCPQRPPDHIVYTASTMRKIAIFALIGLITLPACTDERRRSPQTMDTRARSLRAEAVDVLKWAATSDNGLARVEALEALSQTLGREAAPYYNDAISDPAPPIRYAACMAIGQSETRDSIGLIRTRLRDEDPNVRIAAVFALHSLGDASRTGFLGQMLYHQDPRVRANACTALGLLGEKGSVYPLRVALQDDDMQVRWAAMEALARLGDRAIINQLLRFSTLGYADDRILAMLALSKSGDTRAIPVLVGQLDAHYAEWRLAAARGLGEFGIFDGAVEVQKAFYVGVDDMPEIELEVAEYSDPAAAARLRQMACAAAGSIGRAELLPHLQLRLEDENPHVRVAAAKAIIDITDFGPAKRPRAVEGNVAFRPGAGEQPRVYTPPAREPRRVGEVPTERVPVGMPQPPIGPQPLDNRTGPVGPASPGAAGGAPSGR